MYVSLNCDIMMSKFYQHKKHTVLKKIKQSYFNQKKNLENRMGDYPMSHTFQVLKLKVILN